MAAFAPADVAAVAIGGSFALHYLSGHRGGRGRSEAAPAGGRGSIKKALRHLEHPRIHQVLWLTGGFALVSTGLGHVINEVVTWSNRQFASIVAPWVGELGIGLPSAVLLVYAIRKFLHTEGEYKHLAATAASPYAVVAIPGPVGAWIAGALAWVATHVGDLFAFAFHSAHH